MINAYVVLIGLIALVPDRPFDNGLTLVFPVSKGKHSDIAPACDFREHVPRMAIFAASCSEDGKPCQAEPLPDSGQPVRGVWAFDLHGKSVVLPDLDSGLKMRGGSSHWKAFPDSEKRAEDAIWIADFAMAGFTLKGVDRDWKTNGKAIATASVSGGEVRTCALATGKTNADVLTAKFVDRLGDPNASYHVGKALGEAVEIDQVLAKSPAYEVTVADLDGRHPRHLRFEPDKNNVVVLFLHEPIDWNSAGCGEMEVANGRDFELYYGLLSNDTSKHLIPDLLATEPDAVPPLFCLKSQVAARSLAPSSIDIQGFIGKILSHPAFCPPTVMQ